MTGAAVRALGYVRVSTSEQATSGLGLAAQEAAIRSHCQTNGWDLVAVVRDEGESGKDLARPGITEALERLARGEADGLVVAKLDRLTRSTLDLAHLLEWADRARVALVALDLGLDTSAATGRLVASIMASIGEWERTAIASRTKDAMAVRRDKGQAVSRPSVRDTAPDLVERIVRERAQGWTLQKIADGLNQDGIPTVRGGRLWRPSAVQSAAGYARRPGRRKAAALPEVRRRRVGLAKAV